jgi:hypothetical protein
MCRREGNDFTRRRFNARRPQHWSERVTRHDEKLEARSGVRHDLIISGADDNHLGIETGTGFPDGGETSRNGPFRIHRADNDAELLFGALVAFWQCMISVVGIAPTI